VTVLFSPRALADLRKLDVDAARRILTAVDR